MFLAAKNAGADVVKLQKRDNRTLYTKDMFDKPYENRSSYGMTYGLHREFLEFGHREFVDLDAYARDLGVDFFLRLSILRVQIFWKNWTCRCTRLRLRI